DFPHTALQLMVLPRGGLNEANMGRLKAVEPLFAEEGIWPALMVLATTPATTAGSLALDAAQPTAGPLVEFAKRGPMTVTEVGKPSLQVRTELATHRRDGFPAGALGCTSYGVAKLLLA